MKIIVCGGRHSRLRDEDRLWLDALHATHGITEVVHGGAPGIDSDADEWARERHIPITIFEALWNKYGTSSGPKRNMIMLQYLAKHHPTQPYMVIAFPGGRGTADMVTQAHCAHVPVLHARER